MPHNCTNPRPANPGPSKKDHRAAVAGRHCAPPVRAGSPGSNRVQGPQPGASVACVSPKWPAFDADPIAQRAATCDPPRSPAAMREGSRACSARCRLIALPHGRRSRARPTWHADELARDRGDDEAVAPDPRAPRGGPRRVLPGGPRARASPVAVRSAARGSGPRAPRSSCSPAAASASSRASADAGVERAARVGQCAYPTRRRGGAGLRYGECACLRCCRGFSGANNGLVRYEMVDRLYEGFRAVLARYRAPTSLKVEDDAPTSAGRGPAGRPLRRLVVFRVEIPGGLRRRPPRSSAQPLRKLPPGRARAAALLRRRQRLPLGRADPAAPAARDAAAAGPGGRLLLGARPRRRRPPGARVWPQPRVPPRRRRVGSARAAARVRPLRRGHAASVLVRVGLY